MPLTEEQIAAAVEAGIIDKEKHEPLLTKIGRYSRMAGITEEDILLPFRGAVTEQEYQYIKKWRGLLRQGCYGMIYTGSFVGIPKKMKTCTAVLMRNYVDARILSIEDAMHEDPTVLCLSDFGAEPAEFQAKMAVRILMQRMAASKVTILYVPQMSLVGKWYGPVALDILDNAFEEVVNHG